VSRFLAWVLTVQEKITIPSIYLILEAHGKTVVDSGVGMARKTAGAVYMLEIGLQHLLVHGEWRLELFVSCSDGMVYCTLYDGEAQCGDVESVCEQAAGDGIRIGSYEWVHEEEVDNALYVHSYSSTELKANVDVL
jgi:hypothetical protein